MIILGGQQRHIDPYPVANSFRGARLILWRLTKLSIASIAAIEDVQRLTGRVQPGVDHDEGLTLLISVRVENTQFCRGSVVSASRRVVR